MSHLLIHILFFTNYFHTKKKRFPDIQWFSLQDTFQDTAIWKIPYRKDPCHKTVRTLKYSLYFLSKQSLLKLSKIFKFKPSFTFWNTNYFPKIPCNPLLSPEPHQTFARIALISSHTFLVKPKNIHGIIEHFTHRHTLGFLFYTIRYFVHEVYFEHEVWLFHNKNTPTNERRIVTKENCGQFCVIIG